MNVFNALLELPFQPRRYERKWEIPPGTRRFSLCSSRPYAEVSKHFAALLSRFAQGNLRILVECAELHGVSKCAPSLNRRTVEIAHEAGLLHAKALLNGTERNAVLLRFFSLDCALVCEAGSDLERCLGVLRPVEFFVTFWTDHSTVVPLLFEQGFSHGRHSHKRPEQYYIEGLGRYEAAVFLSHGHVHMEMMLRTSAWADKALRLLEEFTGLQDGG